MDRRRGCAFEGVQIDFDGFLISHTRIDFCQQQRHAYYIPLWFTYFDRVLLTYMQDQILQQLNSGWYSPHMLVDIRALC